MKIAISADGPNLDSPVFKEFMSAPFLLIVNMETMHCESIAHVPAPGSDQQLAMLVLEHRCEALITGELRTEAFNILANDHVTRFNGVGLSAKAALKAMEDRELQLIRNPDGVDECQGNPPELDDLRSCSGAHHH